VHGAEFKAQVLAECQQPGASVAAIALANGLNLLRKWLVGRGIKRTGLAAPRTVARKPPSGDTSVPALQCIPVQITPASTPVPVPVPVPATATATATATAAAPKRTAPSDADEIRVELTRGATRLSVRWPSARAAACAAWLRELASVALKD